MLFDKLQIIPKIKNYMFNKKSINRLVYSELHTFFGYEGEKQVKNWLEKNRCLKTEKLYERLPKLNDELSSLKENFESLILASGNKENQKIIDLKNKIEIKEKQIALIKEKTDKYKESVGALAILYVYIEVFNNYILKDINDLYIWYSFVSKLVFSNNRCVFYVPYRFYRKIHTETQNILLAQIKGNGHFSFMGDYYYDDEEFFPHFSQYLIDNIKSSKILRDYVREKTDYLI